MEVNIEDVLDKLESLLKEKDLRILELEKFLINVFDLVNKVH